MSRCHTALRRVLPRFKQSTDPTQRRLDKDSRGLLILTQDGALAKAIIGGNNVPKTYEVEVDAAVSEAQLVALNGPISLEGTM